MHPRGGSSRTLTLTPERIKHREHRANLRELPVVPPHNLVERAIVDVFARQVRLATLMMQLVCVLLATARSSFRSQRELALENLALRQ